MASTSINVHGVTRIRADAGSTSGAPVTLTCRDDEGDLRTEVCLFCNGDHALARRLADAINKAMAEHEADCITPSGGRPPNPPEGSYKNQVA